LSACRYIYTAADLIDFDHRAHWQRYLACYRIDFAQLANKIAGTRRQKPNIVDAAKASLLFRALSAHERQQMRSVQRFVDQFGRGRFLHRVDVSGLLSSIDYVDECPKSHNRFVSLTENTSENTPKRTLTASSRCRGNLQP